MSDATTTTKATKTSPPPNLRIACLLPSATEICGSLGLASYVKGVTHECDALYVPNSFVTYDNNDDISTAIQKKQLYILTSSEIDPHSIEQDEINNMVKKSLSQKLSLYGIEINAMKLCNPTIMITQELCRVCAPSTSQVNDAVCSAMKETPSGNDINIVSLEPTTLKEVSQTIVTVANACGVLERGEKLSDEFMKNLDLLNSTVSSKSRTSPRVLMLEWIDPPFDGGHWVPQMIQYAGCTGALAATKNSTADTPSPSAEAASYEAHKSKQITWEDIQSSDPDAVLIACCGFDLKRNTSDAHKAQKQLSTLRAYREKRIYSCNGNKYFARPSPSLLVGATIVARVAFDTIDDEVVKAVDALPFAPTEGDDWERVSFLQEKEKGTKDVVPDMEDIIDKKDDFYTVHEKACAAKEMFYIDPATGFSVFTEYAHKERGKCCGSGCRHCPYSHENVKDKTNKIKQPSFLYKEEDANILFSLSDKTADGRGKCKIKVLFFSGGKDSFLTIRSLVREHSKNDTEPFSLILLTTFDSESRIIAHQESHINAVLKQAQHLKISLLGIPMHRGSSETYLNRVQRGLDLISKTFCGEGGKGAISHLVFGDLHLDHIRVWREAELGKIGVDLDFPLWNVNYNYLMDDLEKSGVKCVVSASTNKSVDVGTVFTKEFSKKLVDEGLDGFGENGEFHSVAEVWGASREQALGLGG